MKKYILLSLALLMGACVQADELSPAAQKAVEALSKANAVKDKVLGGEDANGNIIKPSVFYTADVGLVDTNELPEMILITQQHKATLDALKSVAQEAAVASGSAVNVSTLLPGFDNVYAAVVNRLNELQKEQNYIKSSNWNRAWRWTKKSARLALGSEVLQNVAKQAMAEKAAEYHPNATRIIAGAYGVDVDTDAAKKRAAERAEAEKSEEREAALEANRQMAEMANKQNSGQQTVVTEPSVIPPAPPMPSSEKMEIKPVAQPAADRGALLEQIQQGKQLKKADSSSSQPQTSSDSLSQSEVLKKALEQRREAVVGDDSDWD